MSLPRGWVNTTLSDIADTKLGKMLDKKKNKGRPIRYLRNVNVRWGVFDLSDLQEMRVTTDEIAELSVRDGDVFVCEGGEPGRAAVWRDGTQELVFQKALHRLRALDEVQPDYLASYLRFAVGHHNFSGLLTGTTIKHLPQVALQRMMAPVPPAAEQRRIVAKLDALMMRLARARSELDRSVKLRRKIRLSALKQLFDRFSAEPFEKLDDICKIGTGSTPKRGDSRYYAKGKIPWITSGVVNQRIVNEPTEYITDAALKETNCKVFPVGSLVVALYGEGKTRGKVAKLAIAAATNQALAALHNFDERVDPEWIAMFLEARYQETREEAAGGVQPNLNLGIIKAIRLPVPPLYE